MDRKQCSRCSRPADFSLAFLVSIIGVRPRGQKCTQTVPLCKSCIQAAAPLLASTPLQNLREPLTTAYTALGGGTKAAAPAGRPCLHKSADGDHQGGEAALSCRLCLIACNSRKFTCGQAPSQLPVTEEGFSGDR
jgi:hypothetical protein